jgi:hypothetical protein
VRLAQLEQPEQPELKRLTLFVRGQDGASTPAVSCDDEFVVELHGADENGNARRIDLAEIGASTKLTLCGDVSAVMATQSPWVQSGDVLEMRMALGGKAGELDIELDPSLGYYSMCDALRVNLIAGDPAKVVASLASGDATVENGKELVVKAHLADEYDNKVEAAQGVEWNSLQEVPTARQEDSQGSEGGGDQLYLLQQRKLKGAAATLKAVVVTARPLHEPTSFSLQISAQVKQQDGPFHTFEVQEPLQVTVSPGRKVVAKLDTSFVQVHSNDDGAMVEMDEPRVSQLPQPEQDPIPHVATPGSILPPLAVRVGFENGGYLERPKVCKLGLKLNDTTRNLCLVDERPGGNEDRARKDVELHIAGQESVQALLVEGLQAPEVPGEYELELCLSEFGGIKGLPTKEVLSRAKRAEVKKNHPHCSCLRACPRSAAQDPARGRWQRGGGAAGPAGVSGRCVRQRADGQ